jgi:hypothetical protein
MLAIYDDRFYSIAVSIRLALFWQTMTLTKAGALFINKIDNSITRFFH